MILASRTGSSFLKNIKDFLSHALSPEKNKRKRINKIEEIFPSIHSHCKNLSVEIVLILRSNWTIKLGIKVICANNNKFQYLSFICSRGKQVNMDLLLTVKCDLARE